MKHSEYGGRPSCRTVVLWAALAGVGQVAASTSPQELNRRDPFWPIGYRPAAVREAAPPDRPPPQATPERVVSEEQWRLAEREFGISPPRVSVVELDGEALVSLRGQIRAVGETLQFSNDGIRFHWRVLSISREGVRFERLTAQDAPAP